MTKLEKQKEYFFTKGPSQKEYREILEKLYQSASLPTKTYEEFCKKIDNLNKEIQLFEFSDGTIQKEYRSFWIQFIKFYDYITYNLHNYRQKKDGLAPHMSYMFRFQKLIKDDIENEKRFISTIIPTDIEIFEGDWDTFLLKKFQPYVQNINKKFNVFLKELNDKTLFQESKKIKELEILKINTISGLLEINTGNGLVKLNNHGGTLSPKSNTFEILLKIAQNKGTYEELGYISKSQRMDLTHEIKTIKKLLKILPKNNAKNEDIIRNNKNHSYTIKESE